MRPKQKFALALALVMLLFLLTASGVFFALWGDLPGDDRRALTRIVEGRDGLLFLLGLAIFFAFYLTLHFLFKAYIVPATKLAEDVRIIQTVNPAHRAAVRGGGEMKKLAVALNALADTYCGLKADVETRISDANARVEAEKNRLAALMSDLTQGVLVCNTEGRILLYNARAKQLLDEPSGEKGSIGGALIGLGRSVFAIMDKSLIVHALDTVRHKLAEDNADPSAHLVTATARGQLVRANMTPILDRERNIGGFVLTLDNITRTVEINSRRDALLQSLTEGTRASLANIRAAIETMLEYPAMSEQHRDRFAGIISDEAEKLSARLARTLAEHTDSLKTQWPLEDMLGADLLSTIRRRLESELGVSAGAKTLDAPVWLSVDSYSIVQAMVQVAARARNDFGARELVLSLRPQGRFARIELSWPGKPSDSGISEWESELLRSGGLGLSLDQLLERHGGEAWCKAENNAGTMAFCLQLPTTMPAKTASLPVTQESRPEYYDFDLFNQPGQRPELDDRRLSELSYTVFDTETTGLEPSEGDEIIAIGAVRIVNGRLLRHETFDQLIDPRRAVSSASVEVHGITPDMLAGQPMIHEVLPAFARFVEDTVLVAHNAAFDMRFLQLKEQRTGVKFIQPVLDTLLLSAVAHPGYDAAEHKLEAIAGRLGIDVIGRHTALGDAIVTGEIFLKLVPLLAERGIHTLKDAREASQKTLYAKLDY
jgi:DNA polymerase III subunit epsilon